MADQSHLEILEQGVRDWNSWRERNLSITPDLSGADLSGANLTGVNLAEANFSRAYLAEANEEEYMANGPYTGPLTSVNVSKVHTTRA
jgi:uncharacterized protein YjbI with pentapeptide repeats